VGWMMFSMLIFFLFTAILVLIFIFQALFQSDKKLENRIQHYLSVKDEKVKRKQFNLNLKFQMAKKRFRKKILTKKNKTKLEVKLARAGLSLKPEEFVLFQWILTAFIGFLFFFITSEWLFGLMGGLFGYLVPRWYLGRKIRQRISEFNNGLTDMITTVVGSLRAGFSFQQSLMTVVEEAASPIKEEMESVLKEMQYGSSLEDSLNHLQERMPSEDLDLMIQAILIQRQVGGNLATVLDKIVETIRGRTKIQRQISTLTAQGRLSGIVVGLLPIILGTALYFIQPSYIGALFHHPIGLIMLVAGGISAAIGFFMIKKITTIEV
jgi:tight adherence protein B